MARFRAESPADGPGILNVENTLKTAAQRVSDNVFNSRIAKAISDWGA